MINRVATRQKSATPAKLLRGYNDPVNRESPARTSGASTTLNKRQARARRVGYFAGRCSAQILLPSGSRRYAR